MPEDVEFSNPFLYYKHDITSDYEKILNYRSFKFYYQNQFCIYQLRHQYHQLNW